MKLLLSGIVVSLSFFSTVSAQLEKVKDLSLHNTSIASVDRLGNFYFVLPSGRMQKYDSDGNLLDETSEIMSPITLLEPWNPLKVFTYSNHTKQYQYWDHHLGLLEDKKLEASLSITPDLVCPANEANKAWILDVADFSLKRVNLITNQIELETSLPADWIENANFVFIREYQNRVFLLDKGKGILMLNKLGIPITSIEIQGLTFFNFLGEELCYRNGNEVLLADLFTGEKRKVATLKNTQFIRQTIITDERMVIVNDNNVEIYRFKD